MKRSNRLIMLIGVFLAALAFVFVIILLQNPSHDNQPGTSAAPTKLPTVVAAVDIPLGVAVTTDMLTTKTLATEARLPGTFQDPSQVTGNVARANIKAGQQVTATLFTDTGASSSVQCPAGFTCMAVQVDQVSGVGTLIKRGDYVDVVAQVSPTFPTGYFATRTTTTPTAGDAVVKYDPTSVKMLLQGLQVVATLLPPPPAPQTGTASPAPAASAGTALNGQQEIVILAVTQQQAEVVKFAQLDGVITLTLRSPADFVDPTTHQPIVPPAVKTTGLILKTMIDNWGVLPPLPIVIPAPVPAP